MTAAVQVGAAVEPAKRLPLYTVSQARTYRRCAREALYAYELRTRAVADAGSLRFGTLVHHGLAAWFLAAQSGADRLVAAHASIAANATDDVDPFELVRAEELLRGYDARWGEEGLDVLAVEVEFRAPLRNPQTGAASRTFDLGGKLDAIVRDHHGRVLIVEHKTTSEQIGAGSDYWRKLTLDAQVSTYFVGARALGYEPEACIYDVLGKPKLRPLKATPEVERKLKKDGTPYAGTRTADETADEFRARFAAYVAEHPAELYQRGEVVRLDDEERDAAHDLWHTAASIREARVSGRWPRNPDGCERYHRMCSYFDVCTRVASLDDASRFQVLDTPHAELSADAVPAAND